jgi:hypothetical protein
MFVAGAASGVPGKGSTSRLRWEARREGLGWAASATAADATAPAAMRQQTAIVNAAIDRVRPMRSLKLRALLNLHPP